MVLLASDKFGNTSQIKTSETYPGTYDINRTNSFTSRSPKKINTNEYHQGTHKDLGYLFHINYCFAQHCIHPQPQHQIPCLISRHSSRNPLLLWTLFTMQSLCQIHVPSHWTAIFKKDWFLALAPLTSISPSAHTHIHSFHRPTELKVNNNNTTMDLSLISQKRYHTLYTISSMYFYPRTNDLGWRSSTMVLKFPHQLTEVLKKVILF